LKKNDHSIFWIIKPYSASGSYVLSYEDDSRLVNDVTYRVACMYQPASANTRYSAPSLMSNSITATPSNLPNAPQSVSMTSVGTTSLDLRANWTRPSDFSEWSADTFTIKLKLVSSDDVEFDVELFTDVVEHTFTDLLPNLSYKVHVKYCNIYGNGPALATPYVAPTRVSDAPYLISAVSGNQSVTLNWSAPAYDGGTPVGNYQIWRDGALLTTVSQYTFSHVVSGLTNGVQYSFKIRANNNVGGSAFSDIKYGDPYGQMSILSVVPSGKTLTITVQPNGRSIDHLMLIALDTDPNDLTDGNFILEIPNTEIPQSKTGSVQVVKTFNTFTSAISFWCVIAHNEINTHFLKST
jgi:hypothetical protein